MIKWIKRRWFITQYYWRWLRMSRAQRKQAKAMHKLLSNVFGNAPVDKIMAGEGCSWNLTPKQVDGTKDGIKEYVKVVTGEDVKMAEETK